VEQEGGLPAKQEESVRRLGVKLRLRNSGRTAQLIEQRLSSFRSGVSKPPLNHS